MMHTETGIPIRRRLRASGHGGRATFRIPHSAFRVSRLLLFALAILVALAPRVSSAKLAVFVDGRVLKVDDARLVGFDIVLELPGGGVVTVSAVEIDRVIADEVEEPKSRVAIVDPSCSTDWVSDALPDGLPFRESIEAASRRTNIHPLLVAAIVQTESDFNPRAVSRAGAAGLMQLMPATATDHQVIDVFDPSDNLRGGTSQLRAMLDRFQSLTLALAAYNSGATTVDRYHGVPPYRETRDYVRRVIELFCPEE